MSIQIDGGSGNEDQGSAAPREEQAKPEQNKQGGGQQGNQTDQDPEHQPNEGV